MTIIRLNIPFLIGAAHHEAGESVPVDERRAVQLIEDGVAERVEFVQPEPPPIETATATKPAERASKLTAKTK